MKGRRGYVVMPWGDADAKAAAAKVSNELQKSSIGKEAVLEETKRGCTTSVPSRGEIIRGDSNEVSLASLVGTHCNPTAVRNAPKNCKDKGRKGKKIV